MTRWHLWPQNMISSLFKKKKNRYLSLNNMQRLKVSQLLLRGGPREPLSEDNVFINVSGTLNGLPRPFSVDHTHGRHSFAITSPRAISFHCTCTSHHPPSPAPLTDAEIKHKGSLMTSLPWTTLHLSNVHSLHISCAHPTHTHTHTQGGDSERLSHTNCFCADGQGEIF